ncbi:MAG TPA: cupredoxin family copper-binding protein [Candidatus Methanoperedens sp.]
MKNIWFVGLLIAVVLLSGCTAQPKGTPQPTQPAPTQTITTQPTVTQTLTAQPGTTGTLTATPAGTQTLTAQPVSVEIKDFKFNPATITIAKGTTVTWTNMDSVAHTVTIKSGTGFDSGTLQTGDTFSFSFNTPGTFDYGCSIHTSMSGKIIVQ